MDISRHILDLLRFRFAGRGVANIDELLADAQRFLDAKQLDDTVRAAVVNEIERILRIYASPSGDGGFTDDIRFDDGWRGFANAPH